MEIRWMTGRDLSEVSDIERACFGRDAFTEATIRIVMRRRHVIGNVALEPDSNTASGYSLYSLQPDHIEILRLAVHPIDQRCGYGSAIVQRIVDKLTMTESHRESVICRVPEACLEMLLMLKAKGFVATDYAAGSVTMTFSKDTELLRWRSDECRQRR